MHRLALVLLCLFVFGPMVEARVAHVEVLRREPFALGQEFGPRALMKRSAGVPGSQLIQMLPPMRQLLTSSVHRAMSAGSYGSVPISLCCAL